MTKDESGRTGTDRLRRRALLTGAVAGVAGATVAATSGPAAAVGTAGGASDWFNVKDYGALGNGGADDTAAVQGALDAAATAGGGTVYFPAGKYLVKPNGSTPALTVGGNCIRLVGAGSKASVLVKGADGILLRISGAGPDNSGATHRRYCAVEDLGCNGNGKPGLVLELYYNDNTVVRDVYITSNPDICIDGVELWDSRFTNLVVESSTGAPFTAKPNMWLRNASAASGWGSSVDNTNQVHLVGCRFEAFGTGALWITAGNSNNPNGIHLTDCKFETSQMQGGPHLKVDASSKHVHARNIYCYAGNFAAGTTATPQNIIAWAGVASSLENVLIANGGVATVNSGIDLYAGPGTTAVLRDVVGLYGTAPTGHHVYYETSSTGDFRLENTYANTGSQGGNTVPAGNAPNPPLRLVNGPVTDASFTHPPANGTLAVDTANQRLYVRVGGAWKWSALNS
ncbi:glycosyl hydrolase family 28-related protein [Streptomyces sp. TLI_171]|uniref:glycosyl hydrolase family 28-related protein n=1 Tax=Streptomyces sp. TLI_171 TaxID=1938859 RepID=UPI000C591502|nr:glycosyl hydrolase family 28-related protein [Streptomyces sp. TLI_171]RKE22964.1 pectate lyase-like protein [Streptomyces sp. TLI_171]